MGETTFYRYVPITEEDFRPFVEGKDAYVFPIKEDSDEEIQRWIDWALELTSFEFGTATYIIFTSETINRCCDAFDFSDGKKYPNAMTWVGFYLDEMDDPDTFILENLFEKTYWCAEEVIEKFYIEDIVKKYYEWFMNN